MIIAQALCVALAVVFLFSLTIFVHELGHYLAARWMGMVIEVFSIGFGPALWKKEIGGILYKIGIIPVGGYVSLPQIDPSLATEKKKSGEEQAEEEIKELPYVAPWRKIIVIAAGAFGNIVLAVLLAWIVYWIGKPSVPAERSAQVGFVSTNCEAYANGLRIGHVITAVNGHPVGNWQEFLEQSMHDDSVNLTIKTEHDVRTLDVPTEKSAMGIKMVSGVFPVSLCRVKSTIPKMSAEKAGIKSRDTIKSIDGIRVLSIAHLVELVDQARDKTVPITVERGNATLEMLVTPAYDKDRDQVLIGIKFDMNAVDYDNVVYIRPGAQLRRHATMIFRVLGMLMTPKTAKTTAQGLSGPIMIIYFFQDVVRQGIAMALWFTCFLNVNLAILNLLPIPILDGGHIIFTAWELVTRRRVHPKVFQWSCQVFAVLLIGAMLLISFKDVKLLLNISHFFDRFTGPDSGETAVVTNTPAE